MERSARALGVRGTPELAVVAYAIEYRSTQDTVHRRHADLCFSRTGVARVGTEAPRYDGETRGHLAHATGDADNTFRVIPSRFSAFLAMRATPNARSIGPLPPLRSLQTGEREIDLPWYPIHKLFSGDDCLRGLNLRVELACEHFNQKLAKLEDVLALSLIHI